MKGNMKQSLAYGQKAMQYSQGNIDPESFAILCGNMGISYRRMGMNDSAAVCYQRGIQEALKSSSKEALAYLQNNLSVLYCEMDRHSESFEPCPESHSKCKPSRRHHRNAFGYGQRRNLLCLQTGFKQSGPTVVGCIYKGRQFGFHTAQAQSNQLPHQRLQEIWAIAKLPTTT